MAISLKIKGNKRANEGIGNDLVSLGDNRFTVIDAQYPALREQLISLSYAIYMIKVFTP